MTTEPHFRDVPFTKQQALAAGMSHWRLEQALANSDVRRVLRGVYVRSDVPDSIELRCRASAFVIRPGSVVRDRTAAWLHGVDVLEHHELEILPPSETCVGRWREPTRRRDHGGATRDLAERDVELLHGVRVTTAMRTVLDLACSLSQRDALAALDAFMRAFGITREQLVRAAARYRRRRGVVQLRRLIPLADARAESPGESWTRFELIDAGLPRPAIQHWVEIGGVPTYRLDTAYPLHRVVVEYDREEFHDRPEDREYDRERRDWLEAHGWIVVVVGQDQFTRRAAEEWTHAVREALRSRTYRH